MYDIGETPGKAIRALRLERKMTQQALASAVGMGQAQIARIESGSGDMRLSTLVAILRVFDLDLVATDPRTARAARLTRERTTRPRFT